MNIRIAKRERNKSQEGFYSIYKNSENCSKVTETIGASGKINRNYSINGNYTHMPNKSMAPDYKLSDLGINKGAYSRHKAIIKAHKLAHPEQQ